MSTAKTEAAIGLKFEADTKSADKAVQDLQKSIGGFGGRSQGWRKDLQADANLLGGALARGALSAGSGFARASVHAAKFGVVTGTLGATAAAIGLVKMTADLGTAGAVAGRMADRLGEPVERVSALQIAARLAGSSTDAMNASLVGLQSTVSAAAWGRDNDAFSAFRAAGIDIGDAKRGAKDYLSLLPQIANETQRLAKTDVFAAQRWLNQIGVSSDLFPLLRRGQAGLDQYLGQAQQFHPQDQQYTEKMLEADNAMRRLSETFGEFERMAGGAIAPGLTRFLDTLQKYLQDHQQDVQQFFGTLEHGIEWLTKPANMQSLLQGLNEFTADIGQISHVLGDIEHRFGHFFDPGTTQSSAIISGDPGATIPLISPPSPSSGWGELGEAVAHGWHWLTGDNAAAGKLSTELAQASDAEADRQGVPRDFAQKIFGLEHGLLWDGKAAVSPKGAIGAGQLLTGTAGQVGQELGETINPYDLQSNVRGSVRYMLDLLQQFHGNQAAAAAAYNAGPRGSGVVHFAETGDPSQLPSETQAYIAPFVHDASASGAPSAAQAAPAYSTQSASDRNDSALDGAIAKLRVEVIHTQQGGVGVNVTSVDPSQVQVVGTPSSAPRVMTAMPQSGQARNVAHDSY